MEEGKCFIGLEIGSSKIAAVAGLQENNKIKILGFSEKNIIPTDDILKFGMVQNAEKTIKTIDLVLDNITTVLDKSDYEITFDSVNINIINKTISSHTKENAVVAHNKITQHDVNRLVTEANQLFRPFAGNTVLHSLPKDFFVDEKNHSGLLVGKFGNHLKADFSFTTTKTEALYNILECVNQVNAKGGSKGSIKVENVYLNNIADTSALLNSSHLQGNPKSDGIAIVNVGAEFTEISVYHNSSLRFHSIIPIAGNSINADLASTFNIGFDEAEKLKKVCCSVPKDIFDDSPSVVIEKKWGLPPSVIYLKNAMTVIDYRLKEIAIIVKAELIKSGYIGKITNGTLLTGGTSNFVSIIDTFNAVAPELNIRKASFNHVIDFNNFKQLNNPKYSTLLGLIITPAFPFDARVTNTILTPKPVFNQGMEEAPVTGFYETPAPKPQAPQSHQSLTTKFLQGLGIGGFFKKGDEDNDKYNQ